MNGLIYENAILQTPFPAKVLEKVGIDTVRIWELSYLKIFSDNNYASFNSSFSDHSGRYANYLSN